MLWHASRVGPWWPCHAASGCFWGVSHEQETRSPSKISRKEGPLQKIAPLRLPGCQAVRRKKRRKKHSKAHISTRPGCTDHPATRPPKIAPTKTFACGRQGRARPFFGSRVPALFVISAPPAKIRLCLLCLALLLPARPIILGTCRNPTTTNRTTTALLSPISHNYQRLVVHHRLQLPSRPDECRNTTRLIHTHAPPLTRPRRSSRRGSDIIHLLP